MTRWKKAIMVILSTLLLMSQIHLSVYAIHCLCTGHVHLSLTIEKECNANECNSDAESCCANSVKCTAEEHSDHKDDSCHSPKGAIELGIDLDGSLVNSPISEMDKSAKGLDLPLYLLFSNLKIAAESVPTFDTKGHPPELNSDYRYILLGEMLC